MRDQPAPVNVQLGGQRPLCLLTRPLSGHLPVSCGSAFQEEESGAASLRDLAPTRPCWPLHPTWDPQGPSHPARAIPMGSSKTLLLSCSGRTKPGHLTPQPSILWCLPLSLEAIVTSVGHKTLPHLAFPPGPSTSATLLSVVPQIR